MACARYKLGSVCAFYSLAKHVGFPADLFFWLAIWYDFPILHEDKE